MKIFPSSSRRLRHIARMMGCERGLAAVEFALILPIMLLMLLTGIEVCRLVLFNQKMENATAVIADAITRLDFEVVPCTGPVSLQSFRSGLLVEMMRPYDFNANGGGLIVSAIEAEYPNPNSQNNNQPMRQRIIWQWQSGGNASRIGGEGGTPGGAAWPPVFRTSPNDGGMFDGDRIISVETFYTYRPLIPATQNFFNIDAVTEVYKKAFYRARFGNMGRLGC